MSNRDGYGLKLPEILDPPDTVCYQVNVPNDPAYIEAFLGSIYYLGQWVAWQRDPLHKGTLAAQKFKDIFQSLKQIDCAAALLPRVYESGDDMARFRDACPDELFYTGCDGTEHQIAFTDMIPASGHTTGGEPQPPAGGGNQAYCKSFAANGVSLIPAILNTGDVISLTSAEGSGNDGGGPLWYCTSGNILFIQCQSNTSHLDGGDPAPTAPHMSLIVKIGSNYYPISAGSPLTIPSGVTNAQGWFQINDSNLSDNLGDYQICYNVQNNQPVSNSWSHTWDFTLTAGGWTQTPSFPYGHWSPGVGWESDVRNVHGSPPQVETLSIQTLPSHAVMAISSVIISYSLPSSGDSSWDANVNFWSGGYGGTLVGNAPLTAAAGSYTDLTIAVAVPATWDTITIDLGTDRQDTITEICSKITLQGSGVDPF